MDFFQFSAVQALQWVLILLAFGILILPRNRSSGRLPPSPIGFPLIGHLHLLGQVPHVSLRKLSLRYGPIMFLRLGVAPTVVVSTSDLAREVLQTQDSVFASRPVRLAAEYFFYKSKDIALSPYNAYWKSVRKICAVELFTSRRLDSFNELFMEEIGRLNSALLRCSEEGGVVTLRKLVSGFTFNVITRILMRKVYFGSEDYSREEAAEFVEFMSLVPKAVGQFCIGDAFPGLWWLNFDIFKWKDIRRRMDTFLEKVLEDHRLKHGSEDFVDLLITHLGWDQVDEIKAVVLDLLTAGTDTSLSTIEWALSELLHNPDLLEMAKAELKNNVGNRMVEFDDIPKLEFMNAIVKETMRLHPLVPLLLPHYATRDCTLGSYDIAENTTILINTYAIGRDDRVWTDPMRFFPQRFIGSDINVHGFNFELLPFGAGRRICPGMMLGMKTVLLGLCNLVHSFDWSFADGEEHVMADTSGVVNFMSSPLQLRVAPSANMVI